MSFMRFTWIAVVGLLAVTAVALAQDGRGRRPRPRPAERRIHRLGYINRDGVLDGDEIAAAPAVLARLDKNSDGRITSDEARPAMPEGRGRGDRKVAAAEGVEKAKTTRLLT